MSLTPFGGASSGSGYEAAENLEPSLTCEGSDLTHNLDLEALCRAYLKSPVREEGYSGSSSSPEFLLLKSYQQAPVEDWNGEDCYDWAADVCTLSRIDPSEVDLVAFRSTTGSTLAQMKKQDFSALCGEQGGSIFYKNLRSLVKRKAGQSTLTPPLPPCLIDLESLRNPEDIPHSIPESHAFNDLVIPHRQKGPDYSGCGEAENADPLQRASSSSSYPSGLSPYALSSDMWSLSTEEYDDLDQYIMRGQASETLPEDIFSLVRKTEQMAAHLMKTQNPSPSGDHRLGEAAEDGGEEGEAGAVEGSSSGLHYEGACQAASQRIKTTSRRGDRHPKIWEFLIRLLVDPRTNPQLVRWQDVSSATFMLVQPALIARLWGARSKKPSLSANNFARALRYHYNTGALTAVSERHYMYRCGKKALQFLAALKGGLTETEGIQ
ncbi:uncharacterized protein LOC135199036 [Macrobrachium nipponense]|uniref:uncharacterized protein LOC135199036 n=1 Tax=Macrobrachium nipponense TaxID=159736 RepID=UPI0030C7F372